MINLKGVNDMCYKIGIDVGGTFTDVFLLNEKDGELEVHKVSSTPDDPSKAILQGISEIIKDHNINPGHITYLAHGTTVATNAIIEKKGGKVGLLTTEGFGDLLEIGRQTRPNLYDLQLDYPQPVVPRNLRLEVKERILHTGKVLIPLDEVSVERQIQVLQEQGVNAVSVCLLYSYINARHESIIKKMLRQQMPDCYISVSHEVLPEFREYERLSTTTLNAFLMPIMENYLHNFQSEVKELGIVVPPRINQSNGGLMSVETACKFPLRTALSGPSAGVISALFIGKAIREKNLITFDMGGTSTDVSLLNKGMPSVSSNRWVGGYPAKIPSVDVNAVGAGGGSIAWIDLDGLMKVGPKSAGASPGPVCYVQGGTEPTVTDANVILGRLHSEYLLGGRMKIDKSAAQSALKILGESLGLSVKESALGIIKIVTINMVKAIRAISIEKGFHPKEFSMMAFGGAGPLHAVEVARELGISKIIIPPTPGILCAMGLLVADARNDYVKTFLMDIDVLDIGRFNEIFYELEENALRWLSEEGISPEKQKIIKTVDMRYVGQNFELSIPVSNGILKQSKVDTLIKNFYQEHKRNYGHYVEGEPVQLVNFRVTAQGTTSKFELKKPRGMTKKIGLSIVAHREVCFNSEVPVLTPIYNRNELLPGDQINGPAIIEQMDTTTLVFPDNQAKIDDVWNIIINVKKD
jgi:N-methylhydantoinase A